MVELAFVRYRQQLCRCECVGRSGCITTSHTCVVWLRHFKLVLQRGVGPHEVLCCGTVRDLLCSYARAELVHTRPLERCRFPFPAVLRLVRDCAHGCCAQRLERRGSYG